MDDSCAVCAESLEWVAYGGCGHREVCSTCVARLRFICDDRRCCICKTDCNIVFITKALGDYTRMINDFSVFPSELREGRMGSYWYHEDTQGLFDDLDHYKMIKAMCKLSCSVCDKAEEQTNDGSKRRGKFRNIEQLKGHLFHQHRLLMCSLCLEGRKVFICEQKLYTRGQLNQHINTGDSEVDGTESERGGFMGHPMCEFCRTPFYGDNELYLHMSTEHYTCHICQRQNPGQYEYYKNYDDLEIHFGREHFLCEDEACLAKKFIVFQSEAEMKRHNAIEHGGRMSRSKRNAVLQIPTSFRYRRSNEQDNRRGRGRSFRRDAFDNQLSMAIQASFEFANADGTFHDSLSSNTQVFPDGGEISEIDPIIQPFEALATTDSERPSRYRQALSQSSMNAPPQESSFPPLPIAPSSSRQKSKHEPEGWSSRNAATQESSFPPLPMAPSSSRQKSKHEPEGQSSRSAAPQESSFPPLPIAPSSSRQKSKHEPEGVPRNTMAANLRRQNNANVVVNSTQAWPAATRGPVLPAAGLIRTRPTANNAPGSSVSSVQTISTADNAPAPSSYSSISRARPASLHEPSSAGSLSSSRNSGSTSRISHSTSAPNLVETGSFGPSISDFPPVSATQIHISPTSGQARLNVEDVHTANKSLVERIRAALQFDQDKFTSFKDISAEYRQGLMDTAIYLAYVEQFGLSHLVLELARLLPDAHKQKELVETYNASLRSNGSQATENSFKQDSNSFKKGKGKRADAENSNLKDNLSDSILSTVKKLQSSYRPSEEEVEVLSKDGYRAGRGKSKAMVNELQADLSLPSESSVKLKGQDDSQSAGAKSKQRKKTSKFHRVRLGDGSVAALLDLKDSDPDPDPDPDFIEAASNGNNNPTEGLPVRGVWRNGGGQKLLAKAPRNPKK
ncbi:E3 ubiquitin-protein ligase hel2-like [Cornus florida]|uniref:E3 ubiquitin-protein ligase hel2-like n=1 Tax=Cornus florida TaxID=4283 RepID=UPI00289AE3A7|nr:E3 ubiquitin-protein ligase hel2-like [Cornus florida]